MATRYKKFLALLRKWPVDKEKEIQGDLSIYIREQVAHAFSHGERSQVDEEKCDQIHKSLSRIADDYYRNKYPLRVKTWATAATHQQLADILSDAGLKKMGQKVVDFKAFETEYAEKKKKVRDRDITKQTDTETPRVVDQAQ